jgi:hypothetical protein
MTEVQSSNSRLLDRTRETLVVGLAAMLIGVAVYTALGLAWTVKIAVESSQKLRHPFDGTPWIRFD